MRTNTLVSEGASSGRRRIAAGFTSRLNLAVDLALIVGAVFFTHAWRHGLQTGETRHLLWISAALVSTWIVVAASLRHYAMMAFDRSWLDDVAMVTIHVAAVATVLAVIEVFAPAGTAQPPISLAMLIVGGTALILRFSLFRRIAGREMPVDEVLIIGVGPVGRITAQDIRHRGARRVVGHMKFDDETEREVDLVRRSYRRGTDGFALRGTAGDLEELLRTLPVDEVYLAGNAHKHGDEMQEAIRVCEKYGIPFALPAYAFRLERARPVEAEAISDGYLHYQNVQVMPGQHSLKRLFDILSSAVALWLLLPLLATVSLLIRVSSRGPVFFRQERVGLRGRRFSMLKFRSMVVDAESLKAQLLKANEQTGPVFKMKRDPRVTAIGRFIRKYSIDELPQLVNVLRGDMSVVGPRPPVAEEVARYEAWQRRRLSVRPGLTCIWQVSGRNQISFEEWMYLDMQYIDHWSLARDFNLIFRTVPVVITGRGAS